MNNFAKAAPKGFKMGSSLVHVGSTEKKKIQNKENKENARLTNFVDN